MELNQVTLPARDVVASVAFYRSMGFELIVDAQHYARFKSLKGDANVGYLKNWCTTASGRNVVLRMTAIMPLNLRVSFLPPAFSARVFECDPSGRSAV